MQSYPECIRAVSTRYKSTAAESRMRSRQWELHHCSILYTVAVISKLRTTTVGVPARALSRDGTAAHHEHGLQSRRQQEDHCTRRPRHLGGLRHHPPQCARQPSRVAVWCCRRCLQLATVLPPWPSAVRIGGHSSAVTQCDCGVPQGSVLGPLLFTAYVGLLILILVLILYLKTCNRRA